MPQSIASNEVVALLRDLPEERLGAGEIGAVVHVHDNGAAYEVEFAAARDNGMGGVVTVDSADILRLKSLDRHVRSSSG
jgi:hypothetical protein